MQTKGKSDLLNRIRLEPIIVRLITAYSLASAGLLLFRQFSTGLLFSDLAFIEAGNLLLQGAVILFVFILLSFSAKKFKSFFAYKLLLFGSVTFYFSLLCFFGFNAWFYLFLCIFSGVCAYYCFRDAPPLKSNHLQKTNLFVAVIGIGIFLFIGILSYLRYKSLSGDAYDMGLYSQMFYNMAKSGKPLTSLAGGGITSRFKTDPAPILYALLPLYSAFRSMTPYLFLQAAAIASGIVPLYLICKNHGIKAQNCVLFCLLYAVNPGIGTGVFYDFHEQSLFVPLLLWTLYFAEKNKTVCTVLFAILLLLIGQEGAVLTLSVGLYLLFGLKRRLSGAVVAALSAIAFAAYAIFVPEASMLDSFALTFSEFSKSLSTDPGYLLQNILNREKTEYLVLLLLPLGCIPLMTKKYASYFLLLPIMVCSLFSVKNYDSSVFYQHAFGSATLLYYLFIVHAPHLKTDFRKISVAFCLIASITAFCGTAVGNLRYMEDYAHNREIYREVRACVQQIPQDASVTASSELTSLLGERDLLYAYYPEIDEDGKLIDFFAYDGCDCVVLSLYDSNRDFNLVRMNQLLQNGYQIMTYEENRIVILQLLAS